MTLTLEPPFGTYALPEAREQARQKASSYEDTRWGRFQISRLRKKAMGGESGPFDVTLAPHVKARLYPKENRCEKRAFAGLQTWDAVERAALREAVKQSATDTFVFLDVGANVGLYSLFVNAYCEEMGRNRQIVAIEPGMQTCARLEDNIAASQAEVQIIRAAISDAPGTGFLGGGENNRGEAKLMSGGTNVEPVVIDTLTRICRTQGLTHINAMKVDIEGHDLKALTGFFEDAPERLWPELLIIETGRETDSLLVSLCAGYGYAVKQVAGLNTILTKKNTETE